MFSVGEGNETPGEEFDHLVPFLTSTSAGCLSSDATH